ncbi:hypothetical protein [Roseovarius sp. EL26]|uniref:hypothetical protein n=1 Tax=Roseovarius sp. EL26 TaxID=2126672 RepID=UPI000EA0316D|nr:hypothetical protein [Roseovarius sp. EL26]
MKGLDVAKGYLKFFEPDILIEAREGHAARAGISQNRGRAIHDHIILLEDLLRAEPHRDYAELTRGLSMIDVFREKYATERKFELRDRRDALLVKPAPKTLASEAMFGCFPNRQDSQYFGQGYQDVYHPEFSEFSIDTWRRVYMEDAFTPLELTRFKLETDRNWQHDVKIFVYDPSKSTDVIDLWNARLEPWPIVPVPIIWLDDLADDLVRIIRHEYQPLQGNPNGIMHNATIEIARSISEAEARKVHSILPDDLPKGSVALKLWNNEVWRREAHPKMSVERPLRVTAATKREQLQVSQGDKSTVQFNALSPSFASQYGGAFSARWVNAVDFSSYHDCEFATVLPFNSTTSDWLRINFLADHVVVGTEGWVFSQNYKDTEQTVQLSTAEEAVVQWLNKLGFKAELSEPGRIAKQVLRQLDGTWGIYLLKDVETLEYLNGMAGGKRFRKSADGIQEEQFDPKTRSSNDWVGLMKRREKRCPLPKITTKHFTDRNILSLGLSSTCPTCAAQNWHSLGDVDFHVRCARCLESYPFPQGELATKNRNFGYRLIGPFATPDYARGSYATLLTYNLLNDLRSGCHSMSFAPGVDLDFKDGAPPCEVDFIAWRSRVHFGETLEPDLLIGETKSFGRGDLIQDDDIARLKRVAGQFPGSIIICSVLRDQFTDNEIERLKKLAQWARRPNQSCEPTNPLILLTGNELFFDITLGSTWKGLGEPYSMYDDYDYTNKLRGLSEATQAIYLGLSHYYADERYQVRRGARRT